GPVPTGNPNWTHFVKIDNAGNITAWEYMQESHPDCIDERNVHVVNDPNDANKYYLTSLVRFDKGNGFFLDCIKIYETDINGMVTNSQVISSLSYQWENLYPMNSVLHNGSLYVCGYALKENSL